QGPGAVGPGPGRRAVVDLLHRRPDLLARDDLRRTGRAAPPHVPRGRTLHQGDLGPGRCLDRGRRDAHVPGRRALPADPLHDRLLREAERAPGDPVHRDGADPGQDRVGDEARPVRVVRRRGGRPDPPGVWAVPDHRVPAGDQRARVQTLLRVRPRGPRAPAARARVPERAAMERTGAPAMARFEVVVPIGSRCPRRRSVRDARPGPRGRACARTRLPVTSAIYWTMASAAACAEAALPGGVGRMSEIHDYIDANLDRFREELFALLRIPSVSARSEHRGDMRAAAEWLHARMTEIGLDASIEETPGHPIVLGEWRGADEGAPTILIYGHYDVQPPEPVELWTSPPFEPTVRDGRIYARGSVDDKGQLYLHLKALEAHLRTTGRLPVNVIVLAEGEEEVGSPNLLPFIEANVDRLRADAIVISDSAMF